MRQAIIWTNGGPIHWEIYAALGVGELNDTMGYMRLLKASWTDKWFNYIAEWKYLIKSCIILTPILNKESPQIN